MTIIKHCAFALALTLLSALLAIAQAPTAGIALNVERDEARFAARGEVREMRVEVSDAGGAVVFDSGVVKGQVVEWNMRDQKGQPVADGVYLSTIEIKDAAGKLHKQMEQVTVSRHERANTQASAPTAVQDAIDGSGTTDTIPKFTGPAMIGDSIMVEKAGKIGINIAFGPPSLHPVPQAVLHVVGVQPGPTDTGEGARATPLLLTSGGKGGDATASGARGGPGASITLVAGNGGDAPADGFNGNGGSITLQPGGKGLGGASGFNGGVVIAPKGGFIQIGPAFPAFAPSKLTVFDNDTGTGNLAHFRGSRGGILANLTAPNIIGLRINNTGNNTVGLDAIVPDDNMSIAVRGNVGAVGPSVSTGVGVKGTGPIGVRGETSRSNGIGVDGRAPTGAAAIAVRGVAAGGGFAGFFSGRVRIDGNLQVIGTLTKSSGSFKIDHPLDPANKTLSHSFVESPDMMNIYNGNVVLDRRGQALVTMPPWFDALNREFRYQLTAIGAPGPNLYIAQEMRGNRFKIAGGRRGMKVSWQVTGIRQDAFAKAHRIQVEESKPAEERGTYLYPEVFGQPVEKGTAYVQEQKAEQERKEAAGKQQQSLLKP